MQGKVLDEKELKEAIKEAKRKLQEAKKQLKAYKLISRRKTLEEVAIALITEEKLDKYKSIISVILETDPTRFNPPIQKLLNFIKTYYKAKYLTSSLPSQEKRPSSIKGSDF